MAKYRTKIEVRRWTGGGWAWEVKGPLMDGENAFLVTADSGVLEPTKEEAFAAARRVAKQLNLTVEEIEMSHEVKLGQLISGVAQRDAVHIAVAPVVAAEDLLIGQDVGFTSDDATTVGAVAKTIGIVDPFLKKRVMKGDTFWLFLYPQSITSLRHDWSHPAFTAAETVERPDKEASRQWITDFAGRIGQTFDTLMDAAKGYHECGDYEYDNNERYKECWDEFPEFWKHYTILTGIAVDETDACPFTCSC